MSDDFEAALAAHRPELLRHCYRMLGSFQDAEETLQDALTSAWKARESFSGAAPLRHWLFRIATNACLNAKKANRRRALPERLRPASPAETAPGELGSPDEWVTPAPDTALFAGTTSSDAAQVLENREGVALAFVALLQQLPPKQRAALLLKDVVGFATEEIAEALELSTASISSALHRARTSMASAPTEPHADPPPELLREYVRCWEMRDVDGLLALLQKDVMLEMPPWPLWLRGREALAQFFASPRFMTFWNSGLRLLPTRANGQQALAFYREGGRTLHSIHLFCCEGSLFSELRVFIGPAFLYGFDLPTSATEQFGASELSG